MQREILGKICQEQQEGKILTKKGGKLDMLQATFWLFSCWDILVSARYEVGGKNFAQKVSNEIQRVNFPVAT